MDEQSIREKSRTKYDAQAGVYEASSDGRFCARVYPAVIGKICEAPVSSLLDVGCGTGNILLRVPDGPALFGIDLSEQMVARANGRLNGRARLTVGDAEALPFEDAGFDTVCCTFSFHHYPNAQKVIAEMSRVLKAAGRLILADPYMRAPLRQLTNAVLPFSRGGDFHIYSRREMERLLGEEGLSLVSFEHPTNDTFLLSAVKRTEG